MFPCSKIRTEQTQIGCILIVTGQEILYLVTWLISTIGTNKNSTQTHHGEQIRVNAVGEATNSIPTKNHFPHDYLPAFLHVGSFLVPTFHIKSFLWLYSIYLYSIFYEYILSGDFADIRAIAVLTYRCSCVCWWNV